tara:strand:+ start:7616 stop:9643 length:2028 start_codon:yes stop_codon:yes gene_type:complete
MLRLGFMWAALILLFAPTLALHAQTPALDAVRTPFTNTLQEDWFNQVLPDATRFSEKSGEPPVLRGYRAGADGSEELVGFVFLSADVPPEEKGFAAPVDMLIGMNTDGVLTGIKVLNYTESYRYSLGDFVADPAFQAQFQNKAIEDEFRVMRDIDGLAGATMTSFAISQGARGAARRVASAYLGYEEVDQQTLASIANAKAEIESLRWEDMLAKDMIKVLTVPLPMDQEIILSAMFIGHPVIGQYMIGAADYERADRDSRARLGGDGLILLAVGGSGATQFRANMLSIAQGDGTPQRLDPNHFVTAGSADDGEITGHANYAGAIVLEDTIDLAQPFSILYKPRSSPENLAMEYSIYPLGQALINGDPILSEADLERERIAQSNIFVRLWFAPPWGVTPWAEVLVLSIILALVLTAFLRKDARIRWVALCATLLYLGFYKGGFLSVAHITGAIHQGPSIFLGNLPMLMIIVFTVITTIIWGRVFCSSLCPFGAVQDVIARFTPKAWRLKMPQAIHDNALYVKYAILALIVGAAISGSSISLFQYFEPFGTLFFFSSSALLWTILILILIASAVVERFYCRYVCPLGAALGIVSLVSPLRIKRVSQCTVCKVCEHACPTGAIRKEKIDFKECVRCDICESKLIQKAGSCRHSMLEITRRQKPSQRIPSREIDSYSPA